MKFAIAALMAVAASASPFAPKSKNNHQAKYVNGLLRKAKTLRKLNEEYLVDISSYSVKFEKCQFVRMYDDEVAENEEAKTVLGTSRFAIFRLCPSHNCESCNYDYGEYIVDLENYLEQTVQYYQELQEENCEVCEQWCDFPEDDGRKLKKKSSKKKRKYHRRKLEDQYPPSDLDCDVCVDECVKIENMEENGFVDATEYLQCEKVEVENNNGGDAEEYYVAPICTSGGDKIKIGVFADEECQEYISDKTADELMEWDDDLGMQKKLSHALLKQTYQDTCISCLEPQEDDNNNNNNNNGNGNDQWDADEVNQFCEEIYDFAGKCEYSHGFDKGYYGVYGYENQWKQEDVVCQYIKSLKSGTYAEDGEINVSGASFSIGGGSSTTGGQKFALSFFIIGTVGLAVYAAMLHNKLTKGAAVDAGSGSLA